MASAREVVERVRTNATRYLKHVDTMTHDNEYVGVPVDKIKLEKINRLHECLRFKLAELKHVDVRNVKWVGIFFDETVQCWRTTSPSAWSWKEGLWSLTET